MHDHLALYRRISPGDLLARAEAALERPDELTVLERVCNAVTIACRGDMSVRTTYEQVAEIAGVELADVQIALARAGEEREARAQRHPER